MKSTISVMLPLAVMLLYSANATAQANQSLSNLNAVTAVNQNLMPVSNNLKDLGGTSKWWRRLYLGNSIYLNNRLTFHQVGTDNFFVGPFAGKTTATGTSNLGLGFYALSSLSSGSKNTATGYEALRVNTEGFNNSAFGYQAMLFNQYGAENTAVGYYALKQNIGGVQNTALGANALELNTTGEQNTAAGYYALNQNNKGSFNTAGGAWALTFNSTGNGNTAYGVNALYNNSQGSENTAIGGGALNFTATGNYNTASGSQALAYNPQGSFNTASGWNALFYNDTSAYNSALGYAAGDNYTNASRNTFIGALASSDKDGLTNSTALGFDARTTADNQVRVGNSQVTSIGGYVGWSNISDGRYKKDVRENVQGLAFINKLKPVTYHLDITGIDERMAMKKQSREHNRKPSVIPAINKQNAREKEAVLYSGFIAQDVEAAAKETGYDFSAVDKPKSDDDLYSLRYSDFVVPLVKAVQELSVKNDEMKQENAELRKELDELKNLIREKIPVLAAEITDAWLEQNSPNPVKGNTAINYNLPENF
ncbi:tail fiber domain-containing protein [Foetidibacter luteolus]|uniref:tail fiber domain-containing protein n=1 Tax=Foetidibacter luteolus TaxID=2608880 RepID=UPI00129C089E|nr:tail fiber domain-containing protein [Foetidibacter luteolus]